MAMPQQGDRAPEFTLNDAEGNAVSLSEFRGKKVVLYFYPKDMTPGCTVEACTFRDSFKELQKRKIVVLGVSADDEASHKKFAEKYNLPFQLLADTKKDVVKRYGVWVKKNMYGKEYIGIARTTFLIDEQGKIQQVFEKVKPETHTEEILSKL